MKEAAERCFYDPGVLKEDGWTVDTTDDSGANYIGCSVYCQNSEAVIIGFVRDEEIGDMWKIMWIDDTETADLEYNELGKGLRLWEKKLQQISKKRNGADDGNNPYGKPKKNR